MSLNGYNVELCYLALIDIHLFTFMTVNLRYNKTRKDVLKTSRVRSDMASLSGWVSEERMGISGMRLEFFSLIQMETLIMLPRRYCNDACRQYINRKFDIH